MKKLHFSLQKKIAFLCISLGIMPAILVGLLSYLTYLNDIRRNTELSLEYLQTNYVQEINNQFRISKNIMGDIITNNALIEAFVRLDDEAADMEAIRNHIHDLLQLYAYASANTMGITYISNSLNYVTATTPEGFTNALWQDALFREQFILPAKNDFSTDHYVLKRSQDLVLTNPLREAVYLSLPVTDPNTRETRGVLVMEISDSVFLAGLVADLWGGVNNIVIDRDGYILLSLDANLLGHNIADFMFDDSGLYFSRKRNIQNSRFVLFSFVNREVVINQVQHFHTLLTPLLITLYLSFFIVLYFIMRRYSKYITDIAKAIQSYGQGESEIYIPLSRNDEISIIADRFNHMVREINATHRHLEERNEHIIHITDLRRKAEIVAMQAQINPHFLYNTLDTVNWVAIDNDQREISSMINALGNQLRYSLSDIDYQVPLELELQWCQQYVYLQQKRFDIPFDFRIEADEKSREFLIHKMLLQPPLENCIIHGFEGMQNLENKEIILKCSIQDDGRLSIILKDNGKGMCDEALEGIRSQMNANPSANRGGIGVSNVINRIQLYYGDMGGFYITSILGQGTEIRIVVPSV